jgi:hypothetical protein
MLLIQSMPTVFLAWVDQQKSQSDSSDARILHKGNFSVVIRLIFTLVKQQKINFYDRPHQKKPHKHFGKR